MTNPPLWQDISTAPENKPILVYYKNSLGNGRVVKAIYYPRFFLESSGEDWELDEYSEKQDCSFIQEGWYEMIDNWGEYSSIVIDEGVPTLWHDLPYPDID